MFPSIPTPLFDHANGYCRVGAAPTFQIVPSRMTERKTDSPILMPMLNSRRLPKILYPRNFHLCTYCSSSILSRQGGSGSALSCHFETAGGGRLLGILAPVLQLNADIQYLGMSVATAVSIIAVVIVRLCHATQSHTLSSPRIVYPPQDPPARVRYLCCAQLTG